MNVAQQLLRLFEGRLKIHYFWFLPASLVCVMEVTEGFKISLVETSVIVVSII